jgi:hypothetical protein
MTTQRTQTSRSLLPWVVAATFVLATACDDGGSDAGAAPAPKTQATAARKADPNTPESAAKAFAATARTGSGDKLLAMACVSHPDCVEEHAAGATEAQVTEAQDTIREGVFELGQHLQGAEFAVPIDGPEPNSKDVPYRTPEMAADAYLTLTFVQFQGQWLYFSPMT